jgi:hypothetical protein
MQPLYERDDDSAPAGMHTGYIILEIQNGYNVFDVGVFVRLVVESDGLRTIDSYLIMELAC